jgi:hypothetical protein
VPFEVRKWNINSVIKRKIMEHKLIEKLKAEIKYQQEQFDLLYDEHFSSERFEHSVYEEMIEKVNKSKGKIEVILQLLSE